MGGWLVRGQSELFATNGELIVSVSDQHAGQMARFGGNFRTGVAALVRLLSGRIVSQASPSPRPFAFTGIPINF